MQNKNVVLVAPSQYASKREDRTTTQYSISELGDPLGICYVGGMLKKEGYNVNLIHQVNKTNEEILKEILKFNPDLAGFSAMTVDYKTALSIADSLKKEKNIPIVFGGYHPTTHPEIVREKSIDIAVIGQGENTILDIADYYFKNKKDKSIEQISGISYFEGGVKLTKKRVINQEKFSQIPLPLREGLPRKEYVKVSLQEVPISEMRYAFINSARGCPNSCSFCLNEVMNNRQLNTFDITKVAGEIEELVNKEKINYFFFVDEAFTKNKKHLEGLCDELINRDIHSKAKWTSFGAVEDLCNADSKYLLNLMKRAGCEEIQLGVESGDKNTLENMGKRINLEKTINAFKNIRDSQILSAALFIIGTPYETIHSLENTKKNIFRIRPDRLTIFYEIPFKGCKDYEKYKDLIDTTNTDDFTSDKIIIKNDFLDREINADSKLKQCRIKDYKEFLNWKRMDIIRSWYGSKEFYHLQLQNITANPKRFKCAKEWFRIVSEMVPEFRYKDFIRDARENCPSF